jgi:hypothetical protein
MDLLAHSEGEMDINQRIACLDCAIDSASRSCYDAPLSPSTSTSTGMNAMRDGAGRVVEGYSNEKLKDLEEKRHIAGE